jgi:UDP-N-acetylglucosamine diphosphorylase / glucose-1-phosphate thymidylyltransferase / UDP-N-acetylgalactosamine diphosphorylase / glucosamine-1-phosphate N-acetyltransferase / galactosamine-1-phosphate N-acetyltransferase
MQAVILAAGMGTRMRPLTYDIPKAMLPIKGRPILEYTIEFLPKNISEIIIVVNYLGEHIKKHFGSEFKGKKIKYVMQEKLNGTGGAILSCKDLLSDKFLVVMGDDLYSHHDLELLSNENNAVLAFEVEDSSRFGVLKTDVNGNLMEIIERPHSGEIKLVNVGAYIIEKSFFNYPLVAISETEFGLPQTLSLMAKDQPVKVIKTNMWHPIGKPEDLEQAEKELDKFLASK